MWPWIKKILNGESKTITSAAVVLGGAALASRIVGLVRDRVLAGIFGAGQDLDIYFAAFRIPDFVYNLLVLGALSAGFIPIFTEALIGKDKKPRSEAWRIANGVLVMLVGSLAVLLVIVWIFAPWIVPYIAPGFGRAALEETIVLTRIMFLSPIFLGISAVIGGILQSFKRFLVFSLGPIFYNIGIIFGAVVLVPLWGLRGLAWGVVLGAFLHLVIQLPAVRDLGYKFEWVWAPKDNFIREIMRLMLPRTMGLAVTQLNLVAMTIIASTLAAGSISILNLANNIQGVAIGIIGISFAVAAFPLLSEAAAENNTKKLVDHFSYTTRQILLFIIPATILLLLLRAQIVRVIFGSGEFSWNDTILTADTLAFFTLSLFAQSLLPLLTRIFYAFKDTVTPFVIGLFSVAMNIAFALWLIEPLGVRGLALAFTASSVANLVLLWTTLRVKLGHVDGLKILHAAYKMITAALAMAVVIQVLKMPLAYVLNLDTLVGIFLQGFISGVFGLAVYISIGILLKSEEITTFVSSMRRKLFKRYEPSEGADEASGT